MKNKFVIGDRVKVVNYGHPIWVSKNSGMEMNLPVIGENDNIVWYDMNSNVVGKEGVVEKVTKTQGEIEYALNGIPEKSAWYSESQLEIINKNPNRKP